MYALDYARVNVLLMSCIKELKEEIKQIKLQLTKELFPTEHLWYF